MFVVADVGAMRAASRAVLGEAEQIGVVRRGVSTLPGASTAAALARAEERAVSALNDLVADFSATAHSLDVAAVGYAEADSVNAARFEGFWHGGR
ncbi:MULTISPECIES: hypothetical protein [Nocardiaceae]|uniref:Uncharacterized protein n=1 Tax=Rhodococcoides corynebacterioides TaxID=53972 RepID=A0ABS2KVM8_9NOCA|nr:MULTISPECIES: hypothetical protein [Rhodococcus]MBM7415866.1 hypothetical protein [Rhodococcus corynebacterioides]MBP1118328.1 hypothetical protein [Rhodococcus sp. PvP016]